ncbi:MAG: hypothetical protein ACFFCW_26130 [Candidatus Hodarchaeota archaeon]
MTKNINNKTADKLVQLNDLIEVMMKDARVISRDLTEGITNTGVAGALAMIISIIQILVLFDNLWRGPIYVAIWAAGFLLIFAAGIRVIQRYLVLRTRYARFFEITKEFEKK